MFKFSISTVPILAYPRKSASSDKPNLRPLFIAPFHISVHHLITFFFLLWKKQFHESEYEGLFPKHFFYCNGLLQYTELYENPIFLYWKTVFLIFLYNLELRNYISIKKILNPIKKILKTPFLFSLKSYNIKNLTKATTGKAIILNVVLA